MPLVLGALIILGAAVGSIVYVSWPRTAAVTAPSGAAGQVNAEPCRRSIPDRAGPGHFLFSVSACENPAATVATLPLHRGTSRGRTVWYVVTDSSNAADAGQRGVNFAPKLARARATAAVQVVRETGGVIDFPATVDFRHTRVLVPGASGFPPADAAPPSVGEAGYSPLAQLPDGTVINAPQIANDTGHAARVVQLDTAGMRIRYRETVGWYADKHVHYASFDASSAIVAALEGVTLAPALDAAPRVDDEDAATSTREAMIAVTNGPTGTSNPSRQGLSSALVDKLDPDNILHETPVLPLHADIGSTDYSPMCDVRFAEWTRDAINAGDRGELQSFDAAMTRAGSTPPKVTGFQGVQFAAVGTLVNCSLISIDVP